MTFLSPTSAKDIHWTSSFLRPPTDSWRKGRRSILRLTLYIFNIHIYVRLKFFLPSFGKNLSLKSSSTSLPSPRPLRHSTVTTTIIIIIIMTQLQYQIHTLHSLQPVSRYPRSYVLIFRHRLGSV